VARLRFVLPPRQHGDAALALVPVGRRRRPVPGAAQLGRAAAARAQGPPARLVVRGLRVVRLALDRVQRRRRPRRLRVRDQLQRRDVGLSLIALIALYVERRRLGSWTAFSPIVTTIALFRDATMWRETVEYLYQHHSLGYPYTTQGEYRAHAIANLYLVNIIWIIGPMLNVWVAAENIKRAIAKAKGEKKLA
jgi:hypothetical protein